LSPLDASFQQGRGGRLSKSKIPSPKFQAKTILALGFILLALAIGWIQRRAITALVLSGSSHPARERQGDDELPASDDPLVFANNPQFDASLQLIVPARPRKGSSLLQGLLAAAEAESDPDRQEQALVRAEASVSEGALPGALNGLIQDSSSTAAELRRRLVRRWAESDPATAAAWATQLPPGTAHNDALQQVAIAWADSDPPTATRWICALPDDGAKSKVVLGVAYETARTDPVTALEVAGALEPSRDRDEALAHAVSQWGTANPAAAFDWAVQVADTALRQRLLAAIAVASAGQNPWPAATLVAGFLDPGQEQDRAAVSVVQRWASSDPQAAANWVAQFPNTPAGSAAAENLQLGWSSQDNSAAGMWLHKLNEGLTPNRASVEDSRAETSQTQLPTQ
jgi:hypothetical protein